LPSPVNETRRDSRPCQRVCYNRPMLPENHAYFVRGDDGEEYGPVNLAELREWVRENRAGLGTEVRPTGSDGTWNAWQTYPELVALLAEVNATGLVAGLPGITLAPFGRRVLAFGLDMFLGFLWYFPIIITVALTCMPEFCARYLQYVHDSATALQPTFTPIEITLNEEAIINTIYNLVYAAFFAGFVAAHGQTPGKALLRLRVVDQLGKKPDAVKVLLRTVVLLFSIYLFFIPLTYAFFNPQRRAFHDFIAGTYVVEA